MKKAGWRLRLIRPTDYVTRSRHPAGNIVMANHLVLLKSDFFAHEQQAVAVADRYPQDVFAEHTHEFCELVLVWRGNGLHVLNDRPYRITRGDLFYIRAEDKHSYTSVNDLVLQNIIYCPDWFRISNTIHRVFCNNIIHNC